MGTTTTILGSITVISGLSAIKDTSHGKSPLPPIITGFLLGSALLLLSMAAPSFAKALAVMGSLGAFITNGPAVFDTLGKVGA